MQNQRELVVPGDLLDDSGRLRPGQNTYKDKGAIYASKLGLKEVRGEEISVIGLSGRYEPQRGDMVIGTVVEVGPSNWYINIGAPGDASMHVNDVPWRVEFGETTKYLKVGDTVLLRIAHVDEQKKAQVSMKDRQSRQLSGGLVLEVAPTKVPRIIGRNGSMVSLVKSLTNTRVFVGQNGMIWLDGEAKDVALAVEAFRKIEDESHTSGLTDRLREWLKANGATGTEAPGGAEEEEEPAFGRPEPPREEAREGFEPRGREGFGGDRRGPRGRGGFGGDRGERGGFRGGERGGYRGGEGRGFGGGDRGRPERDREGGEWGRGPRRDDEAPQWEQYGRRPERPEREGREERGERGESFRPRGGPEGGFGGRESGSERREGGFERREGGFGRREGGFERRESGSERREGGFERREGGFERRESGFPRREDRDRGFGRGRREESEEDMGSPPGGMEARERGMQEREPREGASTESARGSYYERRGSSWSTERGPPRAARTEPRDEGVESRPPVRSEESDRGEEGRSEPQSDREDMGGDSGDGRRRRRGRRGRGRGRGGSRVGES
ncbi:MAG: exosome complex RNA-binding protein Rrp4 [Thermoplasmatota archaeon]